MEAKETAQNRLKKEKDNKKRSTPGAKDSKLSPAPIREPSLYPSQVDLQKVEHEFIKFELNNENRVIFMTGMTLTGKRQSVRMQSAVCRKFHIKKKRGKYENRKNKISIYIQSIHERNAAAYRYCRILPGFMGHGALLYQNGLSDFCNHENFADDSVCGDALFSFGSDGARILSDQ
jgi:hypothetical protein